MKSVIPKDHPLHQLLNDVARHYRVVVLSGLPGVGKSLYTTEFFKIANEQGRDVSVIQWDIARKAFETPQILKRYPLVNDEVPSAFKLMAGKWLLDKVQVWYNDHNDRSVLLIEAPLVGHRFVEIVKKEVSDSLGRLLESDHTCIMVPIPSIKVREVIENAREVDVDENAKDWKGAKPSVLKRIWQDVYKIALKLGYESKMDPEQYDPELYKFVFNEVCKHRKMIPLEIDTNFEVSHQSESDLHDLNSLVASEKEVEVLFEWLMQHYTNDQMTAETDRWFLQ